MDEIEKRLKETSDNCLSAYESWQKDKKDSKAREDLQESVHELRKVASRVEIELAVSERDEMTQKPIPIPPHRDAKRRSQGDDNNRGNNDGNRDTQQKSSKSQGGRKRSSNNKKSASGGGNS